MNEFTEIFGGLLHGTIPFSAVEGRLLRFSSLRRLPENAKSVICVLFPYYIGEKYYNNINISRYAAGLDYHDICGTLLKEFSRSLAGSYPAYTFVPFIDSSPIPEVTAAVMCGLGVEGKNTLLINKDYGSWVFIGEIVTDMPTENVSQPLLSCENCGKCAAACPAGAIDSTFEKEKCISYITQKKTALTASEEQLIRANGSAWGCDICQRVCPHNSCAALSPLACFYTDINANVKQTDSISGRAYAWRGEAVIKRNLGLLGEDK